MRRKDLDYAVIAGMLASGLYSAVSGLLADLFGFPQFVLHRYTGYACAVLVAVHLILNWARVTAYLRRRLPPRKRAAAETTGRAPLLGRRGFLAALLTGAAGFLIGRLTPRAIDDYAKGDLGQAYHEWSKPGVSDLMGAVLDWGARPSLYKTYRDVPRIALPDPRGFQGLSLEEAIEARRSRREYAPGALPLEELSRLLHAAGGITEPNRQFRAAPSAGALYPIETYAVVHNVADLEPGLYHYGVIDHALEQLRTGDLRTAMIVGGIGQEMLGEAQVCFVLSAIFQRTRWKYRQRTYRYVMLEAGHIAQNIYLAATSMGLGACAVGAFLDDRLNHLLGVDGTEEAVVYTLSVGKLARG
jgi:SagB-type dehydrogenase family enzyme